MKKIILIRHAKSSWKNSDLKDFDRPLNRQGKQDASFMGKRLFKYGIHPDLIISSPAERAVKTAEAVAEEINYPNAKIIKNERLYLASVQDFMEVITNLDNKYSLIFIISHNPGITDLAEYLTGTYIENIPTAGIFCMKFNSVSWENIDGRTGIRVFFDYPKKHNFS